MSALTSVTDADKALAEITAAAERGLTRNELRDALQRNWRAGRLDDALRVLLGDDLIVAIEEPTRGRSRMRYVVATR
jgi:hypothetical protein